MQASVLRVDPDPLPQYRDALIRFPLTARARARAVRPGMYLGSSRTAFRNSAMASSRFFCFHKALPASMHASTGRVGPDEHVRRRGELEADQVPVPELEPLGIGFQDQPAVFPDLFLIGREGEGLLLEFAGPVEVPDLGDMRPPARRDSQAPSTGSTRRPGSHGSALLTVDYLVRSGRQNPGQVLVGRGVGWIELDRLPEFGDGLVHVRLAFQANPRLAWGTDSSGLSLTATWRWTRASSTSPSFFDRARAIPRATRASAFCGAISTARRRSTRASSLRTVVRCRASPSPMWARTWRLIDLERRPELGDAHLRILLHHQG